MVRDEEKYQLAMYYRKRGFSYSEISKVVGVSKATLSAWFAKKKFSKEVTKDNQVKANKENIKRVALLNKMRDKERQKTYQAAIKQSITEYKHYKSNPLFIAGLMLYLSAGDKSDKHTLRLSGVDMASHRIFIKFLIDFLGVSKNNIHCWLILYPDLKEQDCLDVWSKSLKLPIKQFYKSQCIKGKSGARKTLHSGVGNTIITSTVLKQKLNKWIELATKELKK